jgi:hypothetical protein
MDEMDLELKEKLVKLGKTGTQMDSGNRAALPAAFDMMLPAAAAAEEAGDSDAKATWNRRLSAALAHNFNSERGWNCSLLKKS